MDAEPSFGLIVRERRQALGLTQSELARRVGCAIVTVRKVETDALRPSVQIAERLALALNIPEAEQLFFVRLARAARPLTPLPPPPPAPQEIGQADLTGRAIRGYRLGDRIGSGGFGVVYRAIQATVGREVAVKIILPHYADLPVLSGGARGSGRRCLRSLGLSFSRQCRGLSRKSRAGWPGLCPGRHTVSEWCGRRPGVGPPGSRPGHRTSQAGWLIVKWVWNDVGQSRLCPG